MKRPLLLLPPLLAVLFYLAWTDVLPGGWTLHGWVQDEGTRAAWVRSQHSKQRIRAFELERDEVAEGAIVFLGSSTVERFDLEKHFPGKHCLDRGINGDTTEEVIARLHRSLPLARPAGVFIAVGANDLRREGRPPGLVRDALKELLDELEQRLPGVPRTVMGLFPTRQTDVDSRKRMETLNIAIARLCVQEGVSFISTDLKPLRATSGELAEEYCADSSHLNEKGYAQLAEWIIERGGAVGTLLAP